ncbi:MAG: helix-turn-helix domain-containing protein [Halioglobus sp.]
MTSVRTPTAEHLLLTAERLLAEKGLGAVSTREIAREAGQKNHSAISYHFGSMASLIDAILDYRMQSLDERRAALLSAATEQGETPEIRDLVEIMVKPFGEELLQPLEQHHYISLLSQLIGRGEWQSLFTQERRSGALLQAGELLLNPLAAQLGEEIALERLRMMGLHILSTVAQWDAMHRRGEIELDESGLAWRINNLVDYLVGALCAHCSGN